MTTDLAEKYARYWEAAKIAYQLSFQSAGTIQPAIEQSAEPKAIPVLYLLAYTMLVRKE